MIPKIIHYCWFGRKKKPRLIRKCLRSWKKYCPEYQIVKWNEDSFDLSAAPLFVRQALEAKEWAFASDYYRLAVVYEHGGIYLDTDVQLIRSLDGLLKDKAFFGFMSDSVRIATGLGFGAEKGSPILAEIMSEYLVDSLPRSADGREVITNSKRETKVFVAHGLKQDGSEQFLDEYIHVYPPEYFCPIPWEGGSPENVTDHTVSIHWATGSWRTKAYKQKMRRIKNRNRFFNVIRFPNRLVKKLLGPERYARLKERLKKK